jgi:hypothetical protein
MSEQHKVSVSSNGVSRNIMYIQPETVELLRSMSERGEIVSGRVTDDELPAIASLPDTDDRNGYRLIMAGRDKVRAQITVEATNIPTGKYTLEETPVFEDDLDWFILREIQ